MAGRTLDGSAPWRRGRAAVLAFVAVWLATFGCGEGSLEPAGGLSIPGQLLLVGAAEGTSPDGRSIECFLDIVLELQEEGERTASAATYRGTHGGHVGRSLLDSNGDGFLFDAFVGGDATVRVLAPDRLEVVFPANENVDSRFWAGLHTLAGTFDSRPENAEGSWSCEPFDLTQGYVDTAGVAIGRWQLQVP